MKVWKSCLLLALGLESVSQYDYAAAFTVSRPAAIGGGQRNNRRILPSTTPRKQQQKERVALGFATDNYLENLSQYEMASLSSGSPFRTDSYLSSLVRQYEDISANTLLVVDYQVQQQQQQQQQQPEQQQQSSTSLFDAASSTNDYKAYTMDVSAASSSSSSAAAADVNEILMSSNYNNNIVMEQHQQSEIMEHFAANVGAQVKERVVAASTAAQSSSFYTAASSSAAAEDAAGRPVFPNVDSISTTMMMADNSNNNGDTVVGSAKSAAAVNTNAAAEISNKQPLMQQNVVEQVSSEVSKQVTEQGVVMGSSTSLYSDNSDSAALLEKALQFEQASQETSNSPSDTLSSLASQLSDMSYGNLLNAESNKVMASKTAAAASVSSTTPVDEMTAKKFMESFSAASDGLTAGVSQLIAQITAGTSSMGEAGGAAFQGVGKSFKRTLEASTDTVAKAVGTAEYKAEATMKAVGELSLTDLAEGVVKGLKELSLVMGTLLNNILETVAGESLDDVLKGAQKNVNHVVEGAVQSVVRTINEFGEMSVAEVAQSIVALVLTVTKILFKILNVVVELISGKPLTAWGSMAADTISEQAVFLGSQASAFASDISHKSLVSLVAALAAFFELAAKGMVASAGTAWSTLEGMATFQNLQ